MRGQEVVLRFQRRHTGLAALRLACPSEAVEDEKEEGEEVAENLFMTIITFLALVIGLPIAAAKGKLYRGAWAGIAVVSLLLALAFGMAPVSPGEADLVATEAAVKQWFFNTFIFGAFGSFLAVCFYRKSAAK